jgi:hypothetical protein
MRGRIGRALLCLLISAVIGACNDGGGAKLPGGAKTITSSDGALEFKVPSSWSKQTDLNQAAALQAGDLDREAYGVVIEDPREPFKNMDLGKFADTEMQKLVTRRGLVNLTGPKLVQVDGNQAVQYQIKGSFDEIELVYLYTFIETPDRFLKVITWSLADKFDQNKPVLEDVTTSVRQLKDLEPSPTPSSGDPGVAPPPAPVDPNQIDRGGGT